MKGKGTILVPFVVLFLVLFLSQNLPAEVNLVMHDTGFRIQDNRASQGDPQSAIQNLSSTEIVEPKLDKAAFAQKTKKLQIPFTANNGQVDDRVRFYANTFCGTVFVTKEGEIVYSLPNNSSDVETQCLASSMHSPNGIHNARCMIQDTRNTSSITDRLSCILHHESNIPYCTNCLLACLAKHTRRDTQGVAIKETLVGGRFQEITGNEKAVTKVCYFKGNDPSQWKTNISTYDVVSLGEVYDGIELKLKAYGNNVEKLFCVKSGANPEQIKISLSGIQTSGNPPPLSPSVRGAGGCPPLAGAGGGLGARGLWVNEHGALVAETELGAVKFTKPVAYQEINGKRVDVSVEYRIQKSELNPKSTIQNLSSTSIRDPQLEYGFKVASYDRTKDLIIDPLLASTFLGGSVNDYGYSLALDTSGNVYVAGRTTSSNFPTTRGAYDNSQNGNSDIFVSKLDGGLTTLMASTFLGGSNDDYGYSLILDTSGNVYVAGRTASTDFPTTSGAYDTSYNGGDVFVSKLDGGLTSLLVSTFLGGSGDDDGRSLTLDTSGNIYVTGYTQSTNFPTTSGAYDTSFNYYTSNNGNYYVDVFVSKLDGGLTSLLASTFLGGTSISGEIGNSLALDTSGNVYVTGSTKSTDFPTTSGAYDTSFNGGDSDTFGGDVFVSKLDGRLTSLLASTFLGGSSSDYGYSLALDTSGNVYVTGNTLSTNFPTMSWAYNNSHGGGDSNVFISKLDSGLTSLIESTYLGGSKDDYSYSLTLDTGGNVYVAGRTASTNFPTTSGAYDTSYNYDTSFSDNYNVFVSKLDGSLTSLVASTYLGGSDSDSYSYHILDKSGNLYVIGNTHSTDFPTTSGAYDTSLNNNTSDVFVSKLDGNLSASTGEPIPSPTPTPAPVASLTPLPLPSGFPTVSPFPTTIPSQTPAPGGSGVVYGFVYNADEESQKNVTVNITGNNFSDSTTTDEDGYYEFSGIKEGDYTLSYEKEGYQTYTEDISLGEAEELDMGTIIMETVENGMIYGYVVNIKGNPVEYVRLKLKGIKTKATKQASSDADGNFEFLDLEADTYIITAKKKGFRPVNQRIKLEEGDVTDIEIEMKKSSRRIALVEH